MATRIGAIGGLMAFALCLVYGGVLGDNPLGTTVARATAALVGTFGVGWVVGWMGERMLEEESQRRERAATESETNPVPDGSFAGTSDAPVATIGRLSPGLKGSAGVAGVAGPITSQTSVGRPAAWPPGAS